MAGGEPDTPFWAIAHPPTVNDAVGVDCRMCRWIGSRGAGRVPTNVVAMWPRPEVCKRRRLRGGSKPEAGRQRLPRARVRRAILSSSRCLRLAATAGEQCALGRAAVQRVGSGRSCGRAKRSAAAWRHKTAPQGIPTTALHALRVSEPPGQASACLCPS
ncbi:uncharacterized protein CC84DRAFT_1173160 [Paraphaeosphaeria sporulosa]|uniref:Uncharacterized protein n=1 Tax=Paraphaeosphaeria sporulosa TaxID=1460663 RepID=A0A177CTG5_9PLEO|nr:uncharacterized protein CC84DRAFT_1173160 [Paraphaeosphaeria sporulosa]OAG10823.1 hypothetical protein CC84DRAFT_1173160 [Paraphaeosphaeria sporulosa]